MKECPKCGSQLEDSAVFCTNCGATLSGETPDHPVYTDANAYDHTAEFSPRDVSENKVLCMFIYLGGALGLIVALLAGGNSGYVAFHVRQALKIQVCEILVAILSVILAWTFLVPIAGAVCLVIILVLRIIAFFQICSGKAVEPAIVRELAFLK